MHTYQDCQTEQLAIQLANTLNSQFGFPVRVERISHNWWKVCGDRRNKMIELFMMGYLLGHYNGVHS